jgi:pimeloyl-ACP methyl ester carboxylesterase
MRVPRLALVGLVASTVVWTSGAASSAPASPVTGESRAAGTAPQLAEPHSCPDISGFTCSTLRVPLDHSRREAGHLDLAVAAADNAVAPRGTLLVLTGGPGQPGVPFVNRLRSVLAPVLGDYRLVMLDQRGTGANALVCPRLQQQLGSSDLFVPTPDAVHECASLVGENRRFYSTEDTVADLELLRQALGQSRWVIDGVSYGTYVAERYAVRYPHAVSRLVLDSVVPTTVSSHS